MTKTAQITLTINGEKHIEDVPVRMNLADFIRTKIGLTGTHVGCEHGVCGACTLFLDGVTIRSCLTLAVQADGSEITTIEGYETDKNASDLIKNFHTRNALQCGYCTPGMIMRAAKLLEENPNPTEEEVRFGMAGNLCRCTGYQNIVKSIMAAASELNSAKEAAQ